MKSLCCRITRRVLFALVTSSLALYACSDSASRTGEHSSSPASGPFSSAAIPGAGSSTTPPTAAGSSAPHGPEMASLTLEGDPDLAGIATGEVTCSFPGLDGLGISVFARAPGSTVSYRVTITADEVFIHVDANEGTTFRERNFRGPAAVGFDAAKGVQVDVHLTEAEPTLGIEPGEIGTLTAVRGSILCGSQTPGSSTITVTGDGPLGRYNASPLNPVLVECYFADHQITVIGIADVSGAKALLMVSLGPDGLLNSEEVARGTAPRYYASVSSAATLTSNGGHADGDVVERDAATAHILHIAGTATCGTPIRS